MLIHSEDSKDALSCLSSKFWRLHSDGAQISIIMNELKLLHSLSSNICVVNCNVREDFERCSHCCWYSQPDLHLCMAQKWATDRQQASTRQSYAALAQLVERSLSKRKVDGSNPSCGSLFCAKLRTLTLTVALKLILKSIKTYYFKLKTDSFNNQNSVCFQSLLTVQVYSLN